MDPYATQRVLRSDVELPVANVGTVDEFIGDGLMVFFGDLEEHPDYAGRAVICAIALQHTLHRLNARWAVEGHTAVQVRIGSALAWSVVGNMERHGG